MYTVSHLLAKHLSEEPSSTHLIASLSVMEGCHRYPPLETSPPGWTSSIPSFSPRMYASVSNCFGHPPLNIFQSFHVCLELGWQKEGRWCWNLNTVFHMGSDKCWQKGEWNTSISVLSNTVQDAVSFHCCQGALQDTTFVYWTLNKFAHPWYTSDDACGAVLRKSLYLSYVFVTLSWTWLPRCHHKINCYCKKWIKISPYFMA